MCHGVKNGELTKRSNNLCFKSELILESTSKVADTSFAVTSNIWNFADVVVHLATGEKKHRDQTKGGPQVAVLDDRQYEWSRD